MSSPVTAERFSLEGKRALVTGASKGIGFGVAKGLAEQGAEVWMVSRNLEELEKAANQIRFSGGIAHTTRIDLLDEMTVRDFVSDSPLFDVLVNNAGMNIPRAFLEVSEDDFDAIFDLNLRAPYFLAQAIAKKIMDHDRSGSIINLSSQMGHVGAVDRTVYCGSKHAMEGWTKAMAIEFGPHNIRVNTVCPTFIETPMTLPFFQDPMFQKQVLSKIKLGRVGKIEDVVGAVVFLASEASSLITGSALMVDGGWTAE